MLAALGVNRRCFVSAGRTSPVTDGHPAPAGLQPALRLQFAGLAQARPAAGSLCLIFLLLLLLLKQCPRLQPALRAQPARALQGAGGVAGRRQRGLLVVAGGLGAKALVEDKGLGLR